ncbi:MULTISPECIES: glycoside hydrolase domain-containing protein [unclassified Kribbella]|uniref:glycoside hydrolase domain-containing protein n=1 Tax=unclassified Kribbella TaxID=2644121 RepID=UPI0033F5571D
MIRVRVLAVAVAVLALGLPMTASAEPTTPLTYPAGSTATRFTGYAFDTCTAPTVAQMTAWKASPYKAIGIYIGGVNRSCAQPQLTPSWVSSVTRMGFRLIPIYVGYQAPCTFRTNAVKMTAPSATTQGGLQARDAIARARALNLLAGSAIYFDLEHYNAADATCKTTVLRFLSAWTKELHRLGFLSGVYAHQNSGAPHLASAYNSTSYARPDALWIARWDGISSLTGWPTVPNSFWAVGQRGKQYLGDHNETHGGVTLNIDSDRFDAPAASVWYTYTVRTTIHSYAGPSTAYPVRSTIAANAGVRIVCQTFGPKIGTTSVWNKLIDGTYVTDYYVRTPNKTGYSAPIPGCSNAFQTTINNLTRRHGPGTSYAAYPSPLPIGSLAWVTCQRAGSRVGTTSVWDRLSDGSWVTDYYVATTSNTTYTAPLRRC